MLLTKQIVFIEYEVVDTMKLLSLSSQIRINFAEKDILCRTSVQRFCVLFVYNNLSLNISSIYISYKIVLIFCKDNNNWQKHVLKHVI